MKHTPSSRAVLQSHIKEVPSYHYTIDCTGQATHHRRRRRQIMWTVVFGLILGLMLAGWGL